MYVPLLSMGGRLVPFTSRTVTIPFHTWMLLAPAVRLSSWESPSVTMETCTKSRIEPRFSPLVAGSSKPRSTICTLWWGDKTEQAETKIKHSYIFNYGITDMSGIQILPRIFEEVAIFNPLAQICLFYSLTCNHNEVNAKRWLVIVVQGCMCTNHDYTTGTVPSFPSSFHIGCVWTHTTMTPWQEQLPHTTHIHIRGNVSCTIWMLIQFIFIILHNEEHNGGYVCLVYNTDSE